MSDVLNYLGGVIDCDGSIQIIVSKSSRSPLGYEVRPKIQLAMKVGDETPIKELFKEFLDEHVNSYYEGQRPTRSDAETFMWELRTNGQATVIALEEIKPYLRLKQRQAELVLAVDWEKTHTDEEAFMDAMAKRDRLRELSATRGSKYDSEFFKGEFDE